MKRRVGSLFLSLMMVFSIGATIVGCKGGDDYSSSVTNNSNSSSVTNNSGSKGTVIEVNQTVGDNLSTSGEIDWFNFTVPADGYITIDFKHEIEASFDPCWAMYLYQMDGETGYTGNECEWKILGSEDLTTEQMGISKGLYYIKVSCVGRKNTIGFGYSDKAYEITVNYTESNAWETEPNQSFEKADDIQNGEAKFGALVGVKDKDWYKVTIPEDGMLTIDFKHELEASFDACWEMSFYQMDGKTGYMGKDCAWRIPGNEDLTTEKMGIAKGIYYIKVGCVGQQSTVGFGFSSQVYNITVNYQEDGNWETEVNGARESADLLTLGKAMKGNILMYGDEDWYKIELTEAKTLHLLLTYEGGIDFSKHWELTFYKMDGKAEVKAQDMSIAIGEVNATYNLEAGVYYIKMDNKGQKSTVGYGHSSNTYSITVN